MYFNSPQHIADRQRTAQRRARIQEEQELILDAFSFYGYALGAERRATSALTRGQISFAEYHAFCKMLNQMMQESQADWLKPVTT